MKARIFFILVAFIISNNVIAQQKKGLYLSVNPLGVLEPQAAYGAGIGYRFNEYFELSTEYAQLKPSTWMGEGKYTNIEGYRAVTTAKITISTNEWKKSKTFIGIEGRVRNYSFDDVANFTNKSTQLTIKDHNFKNKTSVFGVAGLIGKQYDLGEDSRWAIEFTAGLGLRFKNINREGTPENSFIVPTEMGFAETPNYVDKYTSVYFPVGIRLMVRL